MAEKNTFVAILEKPQFNAKLDKPKPYKTEISATLVQSNNVYKGDFEIPAQLDGIMAFNGDYADVFETNTRWKLIDGVWVDTGKAIPINPNYVTTNEITAEIEPNKIVRRTDNGDIVIPIQEKNADGTVTVISASVGEFVSDLETRVCEVEYSIENPTLNITKI